MDIDQIQTESKRKCIRYSFEIKQKFHEMTVEEGFSAYSAANILGVPKQTAYTWKRKANEQQYCELLGIPISFKKLGRKPILNQLHKDHLLTIVSESSTLTLEKMVNTLQENFMDLKVSPSTVYKFVRKVCRLSFKRISLVPSARVSEKTINERLEWAKTWKPILDFSKNCVFIDEAGFNIGMRREGGWSIEGQRAIKIVPVTRGINISFLGAICSKGPCQFTS
ncbi:Piso0_000047 [Millerozyma farinosa CBS 7064]|uniref:Piso0_000047 protein n=1 Tax=Pichia sorbitophila (strain ATCC MYA-4447 / BCRC 22081 / CBS 7064 / NBRC 10061 / NRRL Y-12695) TaxID=559304 RepID=G8YSY5_PICSO|nr:Piso0_000047 [Millerozyma farinosa CBS 7064]